jgi:hypothetical protein
VIKYILLILSFISFPSLGQEEESDVSKNLIPITQKFLLNLPSFFKTPIQDFGGFVPFKRDTAEKIAWGLLNLNWTYLGLRNTELKDDDIEIVFHAFDKNTSIKTLDLSLNHLTDKSVKLIASTLSHNKTLTTLNLELNSIGTKGFIELSLALIENKALKSLNLGFNYGGEEGLFVLANALKKNNTLKELDISCNTSFFRKTEDLAKILKHNKSLAKIVFRYSGLTSSDVLTFSEIMNRKIDIFT